MTLQLAYPLTTISVTQPFGADPAYYARFLDTNGNPEKGHMGVDFQAAHGTPVYAACDGWAHYEKDSHGGEGIYIRTDLFDYQEGQASFRVINWHLCGDTDPKYPSPIPLDGKEYAVKQGDLIGYADNTGAPYESKGDHLHFGLLAVASSGLTINADNGFNGCIDPTPYFSGIYPATQTPSALTAADRVSLIAAQKQAEGDTTLANELYAIANIIRNFTSA
jgi:hypothetical protein